MTGSRSLVLDAAVFGDEELRFPDPTEALFEIVRVEADTLCDKALRLFARLGVSRQAMPLEPRGLINSRSGVGPPSMMVTGRRPNDQLSLNRG